MAEKLSSTMLGVLHVMSEGHEVYLHAGGWDYRPPTEPYSRPLAVTIDALRGRGLIGPIDEWSIHDRRYRITAEGLRAAEMCKEAA